MDRRTIQTLAVTLVALAGACSGPAAAQLAPTEETTHFITVARDQSAAFHVDYPVSTIVVAQPDLLQLVATTDRSFYIRGKAYGVTNLLIYDRPHHLAQVVDVRVGRDVEALQQDLATALPGEAIQAHNLADGILLTGVASTGAVAAEATAIALRYAPDSVSSSVVIASDQQVMVEVRVIEVSRSSLKDIGFNLSGQSSDGHLVFQTGSATGLASGNNPFGTITGTAKWGGITMSATLAALENEGVIRTLAKPDLIAMSGQEASFLAGGEFPYPVPTGFNSTPAIEFREFGVKLHVTPTVEDNGDIRLKVTPEVSQLDYSHAIQIQGFTLPAISTSQADTTVELRDGQSFAIAGMYQQDYNNAIGQLPGLGQLPVLGALFRSTNWQHQQTELVIIVTPHLTAPANRIDQLPNPLAETQEPSAIDLILLGLADKPGASVGHP